MKKAASTAANNDPAESPRRSVVALKFGGSSLFGAERMRHAAELVRAAAQSSRVIVVVSAMKGAHRSAFSPSRVRSPKENFPMRATRPKVSCICILMCSRISSLRKRRRRSRPARPPAAWPGSSTRSAVTGPRRCTTPELADRLASFGERFSARLFAAALENSGVPAVPVSSSDFVLTCDTFREAKPQLEEMPGRRGRGILLPLLGSRPHSCGHRFHRRDSRRPYHHARPQ